MSDKVLVIAEKPSVASDIAKVLGGMTREKDYFEGDKYVVSSAVGHLLELAVPEKYDVKRGKWTFAHLPMLPPTFDLKPIKKTEDRLKLLKRLLKRSDIGTVVNACDAGREGELIFRYIIQASKCKKTIKRLWLQSMTPAAIREAFENLRTDEEMKNLADAARSRSEADWLVGINGTRAMNVKKKSTRLSVRNIGKFTPKYKLRTVNMKLFGLIQLLRKMRIGRMKKLKEFGKSKRPMSCAEK